MGRSRCEVFPFVDDASIVKYAIVTSSGDRSKSTQDEQALGTERQVWEGHGLGEPRSLPCSHAVRGDAQPGPCPGLFFRETFRLVCPLSCICGHATFTPLVHSLFRGALSAHVRHSLVAPVSCSCVAACLGSKVFGVPFPYGSATKSGLPRAGCFPLFLLLAC